MKTYDEKLNQLKKIIDELTEKDIIVAFSGGVDSSLILKLVCDYAKPKKNKVYALTLHTKLHPMNEIENSKKVALELGAIHKILEVDEMASAGIKYNPIDRCYLCKKYMFSKLKDVAIELNAENVLDGTNQDDLHVYRPGIRALKELGIISPLADVGFTKEEVRVLASSLGISASNRPSAPCLATRFPYGTLLTEEDMKKVEKGEEFLRTLNLYNVRIRVHDDTARIEVDEKEIVKVIQSKKEIIKYLKDLGYIYITLDLEGFRSGSMDIKLL